jgi:uncharacterized Zn finger protein
VVTWWGERWVAALEAVIEGRRLSQGRWHARSGRVVRLDVRPGEVAARLEGGQAVPRTVRLRLRPLSDAQWEGVLAALAAEARHGAALLAGDLPEDVEAIFSAVGASLFPRTSGTYSDLSLACTCSDARLAPCKHIAATGYALGARLDADPFLLFTLRGQTREEVLAGLRARRAAAALEANRDAIAEVAARLADGRGLT